MEEESVLDTFVREVISISSFRSFKKISCKHIFIAIQLIIFQISFTMFVQNYQNFPSSRKFTKLEADIIFHSPSLFCNNYHAEQLDNALSPPKASHKSNNKACPPSILSFSIKKKKRKKEEKCRVTRVSLQINRNNETRIFSL